MPTTVNFVAAIGRVSVGALTMKPKVEAVCAKFGGRVVGGSGSSNDPVVAEFADRDAACKAAFEAFRLDDVEDARVIGNETGVTLGEGEKKPEAKAVAEGEKPAGDKKVKENIGHGEMVGHDAHVEVHVRPGGDHELVRKHLKAAFHATGATHIDDNGIDHFEDSEHPRNDYDGGVSPKHVVVHSLAGHFTDTDHPEEIHKAVAHLRASPAAAHIGAIRVVHDYVADDDGPMKHEPKSAAGEWAESADKAIAAVIAGKTPAEAADLLFAAPAAK